MPAWSAQGAAMTEGDVRSALLGAVPELTAPPDRLAEVRRRAARQRTAQMTRAVLVGVLALVAVGGSMRLLAVGGPATVEASRSPGPGPSGWESGHDSPSPGGSAWSSGGGWSSGSPTWVSPSGGGSPAGGPTGPAYGGPLVARDYCPRTVMLRTPIGVDEVPYHTGAAQVTHVTLCRYQNPTFSIGAGPAPLMAGPRRADPTAVSSALLPILQPASSTNWNSEGCRFPWPQSNITVDVVYAIDIYGRAASYLLVRIVCQNPWPQDPTIPLQQEADRVLGPPY